MKSPNRNRIRRTYCEAVNPECPSLDIQDYELIPEQWFAAVYTFAYRAGMANIDREPPSWLADEHDREAWRTGWMGGWYEKFHADANYRMKSWAKYATSTTGERA